MVTLATTHVNPSHSHAHSCPQALKSGGPSKWAHFWDFFASGKVNVIAHSTADKGGGNRSPALGPLYHYDFFTGLIRLCDSQILSVWVLHTGLEYKGCSQVGRILQVSCGRRGKQQREQNSPNLRMTL